MSFRLATAALLLVCASCSKTEQRQASAPPGADKAATPLAEARAYARSQVAKASPPVAAKAAPSGEPSEPSVISPTEMRGAPSGKLMPIPRALVARPERTGALRGSAMDNDGVERIALMPGSRVVAAPAAPAPPPRVAAPSLEISSIPASSPADSDPEPISAAARAAVPDEVPRPSIAAAAATHPAEIAPQALGAPSFNPISAPPRRLANAEAADAALLPELGATPGASRKAPQGLPIYAVADRSRLITSLNELILDSIQMVPQGGSYKADQATMDLLCKAITISEKQLAVAPELARPSFCSEATYLVFLIAMERLQQANRVTLSEPTMQALLVHRQRDGEGVWGRWNANGPGTARLFHELGAGQNFTNPLSARPGDFLKIWWNDEIGCHERGHSVIFLGMTQTEKGEVAVHYWSSNKPGGYGEGIAGMSKVKRMLFSRLENPNALATAPRLPNLDKYLADMLKRASTGEEMLRMVGAE